MTQVSTRVEGRPAATATCGTRSGYERHRALNEDPCAPCKAAAAQYMAAYRARNAEYRAKQADLQKIRDEALLRLAKIHHEEYRRIYQRVASEIRANDPACDP